MYVHPRYHWPPQTRWNDRPSRSYKWGELNAYVHFPYCRSICGFCGYEKRLIEKNGARSFSSHASRQIEKIKCESDGSHARKSALFFGGGTASLLQAHDLEKILVSLQDFGDGDWGEVTLECEPGTISRSHLAQVKDLGINRIGVCAQSFDDKQLKQIGRKHSVKDVFQLIEDCIAVGLDNVHVDLMFNLPGQSVDLWEKTLRLLCHLPVHHVSTYKLYVYKHSLYDRLGIAPRPEHESDEETAIAQKMYEMIPDVFEDSGLIQYSLTEHAAPGSECSYVRGCFDGTDVLPIGPSAFGRCGYELLDNSPYANLYGRKDFGGDFDRALALSLTEAFKRDVILGLWLLSVDIEALAERHSVEVGTRLRSLLNSLEAKDALKQHDGCVLLDPRHRFFCGFAMQELAALPSVYWASPRKRDLASINQWGSATAPVNHRYPKLDAVISMMRRDPHFFAAFTQNPVETVEEAVGVEFDRGIGLLLEVVGSVKNVDQDGELNEVRVLWANIVQEYSSKASTRSEIRARKGHVRF